MDGGIKFPRCVQSFKFLTSNFVPFPKTLLGNNFAYCLFSHVTGISVAAMFSKGVLSNLVFLSIDFCFNANFDFMMIFFPYSLHYLNLDIFC